MRRRRTEARSSARSRIAPTTWCSRTRSIAATSSTRIKKASSSCKRPATPGTGLSEFLTRLAERNKGQAEKNGLFASHPETQERIGKVKQLAGSKPGAVVAARYTSNIKYQPTHLTKVATVVEGSAGLTGGGKATAKPEEKKAEEKKKGFGFSSLTKIGHRRQERAAGRGFRRCSRTGCGSPRQGRRQSEPGEGCDLTG